MMKSRVLAGRCFNSPYPCIPHTHNPRFLRTLFLRLGLECNAWVRKSGEEEGVGRRVGRRVGVFSFFFSIKFEKKNAGRRKMFLARVSVWEKDVFESLSLGSRKRHNFSSVGSLPPPHSFLPSFHPVPPSGPPASPLRIIPAVGAEN